MPSSNNLNTLHCSIYSILINDSELNTLLDGRIYNYIPQNEIYPFLQIGRNTNSFLGSFDISGSRVTYTISIYANKKSFKSLYNIAGRVRELIDRNDIPIGGSDCCVFSVQFLGMVENPLADLEIQGRMVDIDFEILIL